MTTFNTGAYPPRCTQRDVDMAQPGYWDELDDEFEDDEPAECDCGEDICVCPPVGPEDDDLGGWWWHEPMVSFWDPATGEVWRCPVPTPPILF
jgi:hypothetical protein